MSFEVWDYVFQSLRRVRPYDVKMYISSQSVEISFTCFRPKRITRSTAFQKNGSYDRLRCPPLFEEVSVYPKSQQSLEVRIRTSSQAVRTEYTIVEITKLLPLLATSIRKEIVRKDIAKLRQQLKAAAAVLVEARRKIRA